MQRFYYCISFSHACLQEQTDLSYHYSVSLLACGQEVIFILKTLQSENEALKDTT